MKLIRELGEEVLIARITRSIRTDSAVLRGIGDDCAVLAGAGKKVNLFASDMLVEGVHFFRSASPEAIGWKALAVNVSDVAAMGGLPRHAVISLGLPPSTPVAFVEGLYRGLRRCAGRFGVNLVGGDTDRCPHVILDVAILGEAQRQQVVYRSGARPGDWILVTGRLGGAVRSGRHLTFTPRVREAQALLRQGRLRAMIDLSDGLGPDLIRICEASHVSAVLEAASIPRHAGCSLEQALTEGEDFELLMTASPAEAKQLLRWASKRFACGLHRIGCILPRRGRTDIQLRTPPGMKPPRSLTGFRHF